MKRRFANRTDWTRLLECEFEVSYLQSPAFTGYVTRLLMHQVSDPFRCRVMDRDYCVAGSGYCWLQHFPAGAHHTMTTMLDPTGAVVQWYIDICAGHGINDDGIPWFDDLYLDIVVLPSKDAVLLDAAELDAALCEGRITEAQYELAWKEANLLMGSIASGDMALLDFTVEHIRDYFA